MKKFLLLLTFAVFILSCSKDETDDTPTTFSDKIVLNDLKVENGSVVLTWSKLDTTAFSQYQVIRNEVENPMEPNSYYGSDVIAQITNADQTTFTDTKVPYTPYLNYSIVGIVMGYNYNTIQSNQKEYIRPEIEVLDIDPLQIIQDREEDLLYFIEQSGTISIYDYRTNRITKSIDVAATIGYSDFGFYNNKKELYVPRTDGWVFVYDAYTLEQTDRIDIGLQATCVLSDHGKLFISTDNWMRPVKVYNRGTKGLIDETGDYENTRFHLIPGSNTELIEITRFIGPTDLNYYNFNSSGNIIDQKEDRYHGDHPLDADIFAFFPSGEKFITAREGAIYNNSLTYESSLPRGNLEFSSFVFNSSGDIILAGCSNERSIQRYRSSDYMGDGFIATKGFPAYLFLDEQLISVSKTSSFHGSKIFIEKFEID